ncbi:MAG: L,D-transpeptidase family protein [Bdellovibrionota bacterium]|nr:MAG: L,D-transpeptidase family protein [Bdellovibrionota bacterium]
MQCLLTSLLALFMLFGGASAPALAHDKIEEEIYRAAEQGVASSLALAAHGFDSAALDRGLHAWYAERSFLPLWIEGAAPSKRAKEARDAIRFCSKDGLRPDDYFIKHIDALWHRTDPKGLAKLDLLLTVAVALLAADAIEGRIEPLEIDSKLFAHARPPRPNLGAIVKTIVYRQDIGKAIGESFPRHRQYEAMREALAQYREIAAKGGWQTVGSHRGSSLGPASNKADLAALASRLQASHDLAQDYVSRGSFDGDLQGAVSRFQARHGLPATGEVGRATLAELNIPVEARIKTLLVNLERWRWLQRDVAEAKEVLVNIAGFELFALDREEIALQLPVIVGKTYHATPVFSEFIRYIEVNPYWNVPSSIAANELLPKLKKDSHYLSSQHMRLYDGWHSNARELAPSTMQWSTISPRQMGRYAIRQDPGPWNALGTLKFVFPNSFNVYLHDTPSKGLFAERARAFSHGCIRVSEPDRLAAFLLDSPADAWNRERVRHVVADGARKIIKLPTPVRIHLTYRTAWVDQDGIVQFRPDIYGRDALMEDIVAG